MSNRDVMAVQAAGSLCLGLGLILIAVIPLATLFLAFSGLPRDASAVIGGTASLALALVAAATLAGCGVRLARANRQAVVDAESLRISWTVLVIVMTLVGVIGLWLEPLLSVLGGLVLLTLFSVRSAVIRLTS